MTSSASFTSQFNRLPKHRLPVRVNRRINGVSVEECGRSCIVEVYFRCKGFNYRETDSTCDLLELSPASSTAAVYTSSQDYYQKHPGTQRR